MGSIIGAPVLGRLPGSCVTRLPIPLVLLVLLAVGMCAVGTAMFLGPVAVAAVSVPAGLAIGSVFARFFTVLGAAAPPGVDHEVPGWANSMTTIGFAAGSCGGAAPADALGTPALLLYSPSPPSWPRAWRHGPQRPEPGPEATAYICAVLSRRPPRTSPRDAGRTTGRGTPTTPALVATDKEYVMARRTDLPPKGVESQKCDVDDTAHGPCTAPETLHVVRARHYTR
ncbi:hypothetical protein [Streptomyces sp. NPDC050264]|uniref:hypothetical protein n=1 Tax=Streptomyces sp. NPDC050264 TaxID=3155038 RepID=UPI0034401D13